MFVKATLSSLEISGMSSSGPDNFPHFNSLMLDSASTFVGESNDTSHGFVVVVQLTALARGQLSWSLNCSGHWLNLRCPP